MFATPFTASKSGRSESPGNGSLTSGAVFAIVGAALWLLVSPDRIAAAHSALQLEYSREDWYRLLKARNGQPVP